MNSFKYVVNNTEYDNSFLKSVIQATTGTFAHQQELTELLEDIEIFFQSKIKNKEKKIYKHIIDYTSKLNIKLIGGNTENIFDLYMVADANKKQIIPLFSSKIKQELSINTNFYTFENYKYLNYYILYRLQQNEKKVYTKISLRDFITKYLLLKPEYSFNLVMDIIKLNIIILNKNLEYVSTYQKDGNSKYMILYQDKDRYKNVSLHFENRKLNLLDKDHDANIIAAIESNTNFEEKTEYKYKKKTNLDSILEDIENSVYSKEDFLSNINLLD